MRVRVVAALSVLALFLGPAPAPVSGDTQDPATVGRWQPAFWEGEGAPPEDHDLGTSAEFPTAVSAVVLSDGRILFWSGLEGSEKAETAFFFETGDIMENSRARVLDLDADGPSYSVPTHERGVTDEAQPAHDDMFCADQVLLHDGTVLITGGTEWRDGDLWGDQDTKIFDPETDTFTNLPEAMSPGRWYPTLVTFPDGRVGVFSGVEQLANTFRADPAFSQVREVQVFDPDTRSWSDGETSPFSMPLYPRMHLLPNGKVFYTGSGQTWNPFGETADEATWSLQRFYDTETQSWELLGPARYGVRGGTFSTLLKLEPPYDAARVLIGGGTLGPAPGSVLATTLSEVVTVEGDEVTNEPVPKAPVAGLAGDDSQLNNRRWFSSDTLLPTGEVLAFSGGDTDDVVDPGSAAPVRMAELYDPETNTWRELSEGSRDRIYHNSTVLLPDGRVLVGGHSPLPAHYHRHDNPATRSNNFKDASFEIFEPPYLFRGPRPAIRSVAPERSGAALRVTLEETEAEDVDDVVLVRLPSSTHVVDADQRAVSLAFESASESGSLRAELPGGGDGRVLPPGPYYLFVLSDNGEGPVPSVAETVLIQPSEDGRVVAGAPGN